MPQSGGGIGGFVLGKNGVVVGRAQPELDGERCMRCGRKERLSQKTYWVGAVVSRGSYLPLGSVWTPGGGGMELALPPLRTSMPSGGRLIM